METSCSGAMPWLSRNRQIMSPGMSIAAKASAFTLMLSLATSMAAAFGPALRPGDDTTELAPQGHDEIGRTSLEDAEGQMRHPSALDHPRALQTDRPGAEVVEQ